MNTSLRHLFLSQRGVIFPLAFIVMLVLAALMAALAVMSASEPQIAANHTRASQARALAEAGIERALWALSNPANVSNSGFGPGLADPLASSPAPPPYDGNAYTLLGAGGFTVQVSNGGAVNERSVTATGYLPSDAAAPTVNPLARRTITATLTKLPDLNPPCALCVKGQLNVGGNTVIDSRSSTCGSKKGTYSKDGTSVSGNGKIYGGDGNSTPNQTTDYAENQSASSFDGFSFTQDELSFLRSLAKASGTYYQGSQSFGSLPNGIIFVDTVSGNPIGNPPDAGDLAEVTITGGDASGWLIVMGKITIHGNVEYRGLVYAANDIVYRGTGQGGGVTGAMISLNVVDTVSTTVDSSTDGNASVAYDCDAVKTGGGTVPQGFFVKPGSWREVSG